MKTIFQMFFECVRIQGFKEQDPSQTDEEYILSFCQAIALIPDDMYNLLPSATHDWYSNTARCINNKREYETWPKCEGFVSIHKPVIIDENRVPNLPQFETKVEEGVIGEPEKQTFPIVKRVPKKRGNPKDSKYAGVIKETRKIIMLHPDWSSRVVHKFLEGSGYSGVRYDVISVVCSETRAMILLAKSLGFWRPVSIYEKSIPPDPTEVAKEEKKSARR